MSAVHLTLHAAQRHAERVGKRFERAAVEQAVLVPRRLACTQWPELVGAVPYRHGARLRCSATAAFVCRGAAIVTVIALDVDDLATLLTWLLTGCWVARSSR